MSVEAAQFQSRVSGQPTGMVYRLGKDWDGVNLAASELLDAKSFGASGFYARIRNSPSLLRAMLNSGTLDGEISTLQAGARIASDNGMKQVVVCETEGVAAFFRGLVEDNAIANTIVRVLE